jgi:hypothetical protein
MVSAGPLDMRSDAATWASTNAVNNDTQSLVRAAKTVCSEVYSRGRIGIGEVTRVMTRGT